MLTSLKQRVLDRLGIMRVARTADVAQAASEQNTLAVAQLQARVAELEETVARLDARRPELDRLSLWHRVVTESAVAQAVTPRATPTISVILPTRDRCAQLVTAIASCTAQRYPHWQLVIVDDGSADGTAALLAGLDDPRVLVLHTGGIGVSAARNAGLAAATGEWCAFLDDDNVMEPGWLWAVAVTVSAHPDIDVLYGAQLRQPEPDDTSNDGDGAPAAPVLLFHSPFDRSVLFSTNVVDLGALVVRHGLDQLWFDPALRRCVDWEMLLRLSAEHAVTAVPVLAGTYVTRGGPRITDPRTAADVDQFIARIRDPDDPLGSPRPRPALPHG